VASETALKRRGKDTAEHRLIEAAQRDPGCFAQLYENNFERDAARLEAIKLREIPENDPSSDTEPAEVEHRARLFKLVEKLPADQRHVIAMRFAHHRQTHAVRAAARYGGREDHDLNRIKTAVLDYRAERTSAQLLKDAVTAAGSTLVIALLLFVMFRITRWAAKRFEHRYQAAIQKIETKSLRLISAASVWRVVRVGFTLLSLLVALSLILIYFHFILGLFPWTRGYAENFRALTIGPLLLLLGELANIAPKLLAIALIAFAARYVLKMARVAFTAIKEGKLKISGFDPEWSDSTYNIVRVLIVAFAVVISYPYIPASESPAFKGVTIFIGVLFSLGSSAFLANLIAGYTMTYRRSFRPGDRIKVGELMGDVTDVGLMVTRLRSIKNEELVMPNSLILNSNVINYSSLARERGLILHTTVGIGYETPWRQVEAMLLMAAERTSGVLREPPPFILQKSLDDFAVSYELNVYCDKPLAMYQLYAELHRNIGSRAWLCGLQAASSVGRHLRA